jgi:hypothetical protein
MTIKQKYNLIGIAALLVFSAVIFFNRHKDHDGKVFIHAVPTQTAYGWGYDIMADEKVFIHQEYVPGITGKKGFKSADDALIVGNLVVKRISSNLMPMITRHDLDSLGLVIK